MEEWLSGGREAQCCSFLRAEKGLGQPRPQSPSGPPCSCVQMGDGGRGGELATQNCTNCWAQGRG